MTPNPFFEFGQHIDIKPGEFPTLGMLHEFAVQRAEKAFEQQHRREPYIMKPLWLIQFRDFIGVAETPFANDHAKAVVSNTLRIAMRMGGARAYSFITEAWIANVTPGDFHDRNKTLPSRHPDREDVMWVTSYDRIGRSLLTRYGVKRAGTPHARLLVRDDWGQQGGEGRFYNLLVDTPASDPVEPDARVEQEKSSLQGSSPGDG